MAKPKELVNENKKTKSWIESWARYYSSLCSSGGEMDELDELAWRYYYNEHNNSAFEYFQNVGNSVLPATFNHIPLQRNFLSVLISEYTIRPFIFSTFYDGEDAISKKRERIFKLFLSELERIIDTQFLQAEQQVTSLQMQLQQMEQIAGMDSSQVEDPEQAQQIENIKKSLPMLRIEINNVIENISENLQPLEEDIDEIKRFYTYDWKDIEEEIAQKLMFKFYNHYGIKNISVNNFTNKLVLGKHYYFVSYKKGLKYPIFEDLDASSVSYPISTSNRYIQHGKWSAISDRLSLDSIMAKHGTELSHKLTDEQMEELKSYENSSNSNNIESVYSSKSNTNSGTDVSGIPRKRIFWKSPVKVRIKKSKNKHNANVPFTHFIDKFKEIIREEDYKYSKRQDGTIIYTNKSDKNIQYNSKDVEYVKKGDKLITKYSTDVYTATVIADKYIVGAQKYPWVIRDEDDFSIVELPTVGPAFNNRSRRPYSLILSTKPLQDLYNVFHYHEELMLNLSGTKVVLRDESQRPSHLTPDEWDAKIRLGSLPIETSDGDGNPKRTNFNQWTAIDLSLSASIQYISNMKAATKESMGDIMGIPRQRLGQLASTDQVGTFEASNERSMIITEMLFFEQDEITAMALNHLLKIATKYAMTEGAVLQNITNQLTGDIFKIPKGFFDKTPLSLHVQNNNIEANTIKQLKSLLGPGMESGSLLFENVAEILPLESLTEIKSKITYFTKKNRELQQKARQADANSQRELQQEAIKFQQEFDAYWKERELKLQEASSVFQQEKAKFDQEIAKENLALNQQIANDDKLLKLIELKNEFATENKIIDSNNANAAFDNEFKALQLKIDTLFNVATLKQDDIKDKRDKEVQKQKIKADKEKKPNKQPQHASDR